MGPTSPGTKKAARIVSTSFVVRVKEKALQKFSLKKTLKEMVRLAVAAASNEEQV